MVVYIAVSLILFLIVDYVYIYNFFDSNILFLSSGSKLKSFSHQNGNMNKLNFDLTQIAYLIIISFFLWLINFVIVYSYLNSNFIELNIFSKNINITSILGDKYKYFKILYFISSYIFFLIISIYNKEKIVSLIKKCVAKNSYDISSVPSADERLVNIGAVNGEKEVHIPLKSLYQNLLITGSIGSGKTSGAISNITYELINMGIGGLILDAKGNFVDKVKTMCKKTNREKDLQIVSNHSNCYFELLDNSVLPQEMANRLRHIIELLSPNNNSDTYWLDKVENVLLNILTLMDYYLKGKRNMLELHKLISSREYLDEKINCCKEMAILNPPDDKTSFELNNAILYIKEEFFKMDNRIYSIVTSEITRLTIPLISDYNVYNQFLVYTPGKQIIDFYSLKDKIVVLSLNIGENRALCKIISTFLKLSFQRYILSTLQNVKKFPSFFICDEFQEFVNKDDSNFFSLSREAKCINIISTQSYSSIKNTLRDNEASSVILQNFVNKIWFRNDDNFTITETIKQLGKTIVKRENISITENAQESMKYLFQKGFKNRKSSISNGINYVSTKENEYDENFFTRNLATFEALVFIYTGEQDSKPQKVKFKIWRE